MIELKVEVDEMRDPRLSKHQETDPLLTNDTAALVSESTGPALSPAARQWLAENQAAIDAFNKWDEEHGSPLDEYRMF